MYISVCVVNLCINVCAYMFACVCLCMFVFACACVHASMYVCCLYIIWHGI